MAVHLSEESRADYSDFLQRFQADPHSISAEEAAQRYEELVRHAPPELAAEANQHIMGLLPQQEREVLADNIHGNSAQNFGLLDKVLGKDSVLNTPVGKMILSAVVAYLANRMLNQSQGQAGTRAPSGGLGDLISGILGSVAAAQAGGSTQAPAGGGLPGGLGDILGALGGQAPADSQMPSGTQLPAGGGLPGGLGDILGGLLGGQAPAGSQAPAGGLPSGLGDLLGQLLGGGESSELPEAPRTGPEPEQQQPPVRSHRKQ